MTEFNKERWQYIIDELNLRISIREENFSILTQEEKNIGLRDLYDFILRNYDFINEHFPKKLHNNVHMKLHAARKMNLLMDEKYDVIFTNWS